LHCSDESTRKVSLYSNYWIINNTGLRLSYKSEANSKKIAAGQALDESTIKPLAGDPTSWYTDEENKGMEIGKNTVYFSSKELCIRVENSSWSKARANIDPYESNSRLLGLPSWCSK
jgi:hypothetical protein